MLGPLFGCILTLISCLSPPCAKVMENAGTAAEYQALIPPISPCIIIPCEHVESEIGYWLLAWKFFKDNRHVFTSCFMDSFEWYSFSFVLPEISASIFGGNDHAAWLMWGIPFATTPIGACFFGSLADRWGRKVSLVCTAMLLLAGTLGQALTPTFPIVGPVWLFLFRVAQGVAYGGKYSVGNVYLAERAPIRVLAMSRALIMLPYCLGFACLSAGASLLYQLLSPEQMVSWGWRVPFAISGLLGIWPIIGLQLEGQETEAFLESKAKPGTATPEITFLTMLRTTWKHGILALCGMTLDCASHGLGENYVKAWLVKFCAYDEVRASLLSLEAQLVAVPTTLAVLWLADRIGLGKAGMLVALYGCVFSLPAYALPYAHPHNPLYVYATVVLGYGLLYGLRCCFMVWMADLFPTEVRGQAVGLYMCLAYFSCGLAPSLCISSPLNAAWYLLGSSLLTLGAFAYSLVSHTKNRKFEADGSGCWLKVANIRVSPY
eukprot:EG_transcript_5405